MTTETVIRGFKHLSREQRNYCLTDSECWMQYPGLSYLFDRLWLTQTQQIPCGPMGVRPNVAPVWVRPQVDLLHPFNLGRRVRAWTDEDYGPGMMWQQDRIADMDARCFVGDFIVLRGKIVWSYWTRLDMDGIGTPRSYFGFPTLADHAADLMKRTKLPGLPAEEGIDSGSVQAFLPNELALRGWVEQFLREYSGPLSLLCTRDLILEVHLRPTTEILEWFGSGYLTSLFLLMQSALLPGTAVELPAFPPGQAFVMHALRAPIELGQRYDVAWVNLNQIACQKLWVSFANGEKLPGKLHNGVSYLLGYVGDVKESAADEGAKQAAQAFVPLDAPQAEGVRPRKIGRAGNNVP